MMQHSHHTALRTKDTQETTGSSIQQVHLSEYTDETGRHFSHHQEHSVESQQNNLRTTEEQLSGSRMVQQAHFMTSVKQSTTHAKHSKCENDKQLSGSREVQHTPRARLKEQTTPPTPQETAAPHTTAAAARHGLPHPSQVHHGGVLAQKAHSGFGYASMRQALTGWTNFEEHQECPAHMESDDEEQQQGTKARVAQAPKQRTQEILARNVTHLAYRSWCPMRAQPGGKQHIKLPVVQLDFGHVKGIDDGNVRPIRTAIGLLSGTIVAELTKRRLLFNYAVTQLPH